MTRKMGEQVLFYNKVPGLQAICNFINKETPAQVFFCRFQQHF